MQATLSIQLEQTDDNAVRARWWMPSDAGSLQHDGSIDDFGQWLTQTAQNRRTVNTATLLLSGDQVVCHTLAFAASEKKHLRKLLPFMLEPQLAVDLSRIHVAFSVASSPAQDKKGQMALTCSTDKKQLAWRIAELESLGLAVESVYAIPALLPADNAHWSILVDGDLCHLRFGAQVCTSVEPGLLPLILESALGEAQTCAQLRSLTVTVVRAAGQSACADDTDINAVLETLTTCIAAKQLTADIRQRSVTHVREGLQVAGADAVNLRQGEFAAPLRLGRHWQQWRMPAIAAVLALMAVMVSTLVEIRVNHSRFAALESRIEQRYREVMPDGVLVDAVQQLSAQIDRQRSASATHSLPAMLSALAGPVEASADLSLHRVSYTSQSGAGNNVAEMQLMVSAPDAGSILQFSESMTSAGWNTQARNINRVGDRQHASLSVRGN